jgi:hypothetical protein
MIHKRIILDLFIWKLNRVYGAISIYCRAGLRPALQLQQKFAIFQEFSAPSNYFQHGMSMIFHTPGIPLWHRNYFEHIIRNEIEWNKFNRSIVSNPSRWEEEYDDPNQITKSAPQTS